jgi:hypothetical protein
MRIGSFGGCVVLAFALLLPLASDAQQQPANAPQVNAEKQPDSGVKPKAGASAPQQAPGPNAASVSQAAAGNGDAEREPNLSNARDQGTEFWPAIGGYRIKVTDSLIVLFTCLLWFATRGLVIGADKSSRSQLRAYILVNPIGITNLDPADNPLMFLHFANVGKTPAHHATYSGDFFIADHPLREDFIFPPLPEQKPGVTTLPGTQFQGNIVSTARFTQAQLVETFQAPAAGGRRLYVFGKLDYIDSFGTPRWLKFCWSFNGYHPAIPLAQNNQWADIKTMMGQPGVGIAFDAAFKHNDTDDSPKKRAPRR